MSLWLDSYVENEVLDRGPAAASSRDTLEYYAVKMMRTAEGLEELGIDRVVALPLHARMPTTKEGEDDVPIPRSRFGSSEPGVCGAPGA